MNVRIALFLLAILPTAVQAADGPTPFPDWKVAGAWPGKGPIKIAGWMIDNRNYFWTQRAKDQGAVVFVGDSLTGGWKPAVLKECFAGLKIANRGIGGDVSRGVLFRLKEDVLDLKPRAIVLCIGSNDLSSHASLDDVEFNLTAILKQIHDYDAALPVVLSNVPPRDVADAPTKPGAHAGLNERIAKLAASQKNVVFIDSFTPLATADGKPIPEFFAKDKIHFVEAGYRKWATVIGPALAQLGVNAAASPAKSSAAEPKKLVLIAGKPSHPPRMHEFNAGVQLLAKCLKESAPQVSVTISLNGWPKDEKVLEAADAIVFYMDGREKHEAVQEQGARLKTIQSLVDRGVGIGCMHYAVEVNPDQAGAEFKRWIGGHYENMHSVNPMWEPTFANFLEHPITRGVKPFQIKDEWYFNMRFIDGFTADKPAEKDGVKFTPILVAVPSDTVRDGPYVYPKGPYPHIQAAKGRVEAMLWAIERPDGGRGFGFTGGHFHDNWSNDEFRKVVLNTLVWVAKGEVPADGIVSNVTKDDVEANLDPKPAKK